MSEIKPALTPEEWGWCGTNNGEVAVTAEPDVRVHDAIGVTICVDEDLRHALAALCLHEQPFGFTWEDVEALRESARLYHSTYGERVNFMREHPLGHLVESIASRIEALLPPEEP